MYGENQRLAEGIPSSHSITTLIPVYSVGSFFPKGGDFYLVLKVASPTFIFKPEILYQF